MSGMDLFCALNNAEDSFVKETLTYTGKTKKEVKYIDRYLDWLQYWC